MNRLRDILIHIVCCAAFLAVPVILSRAEMNLGMLSRGTIRDVIGYSLTIGYFYLNFYYLIPQYYLKRRYFLFVLLTLGAFIVVTLLPRVLLSLPPQPNDLRAPFI